MTQNVWEQEAVKDLVQLEEGEFNLCDFALFLSVMKNETAHKNVLSIIMGERNLELKEVHVEEVILNPADSEPSVWMPEPQIYQDAISQQKCKMTRSRMTCAAEPDFTRG